MNTLLVPSDFSTSAENALQYAVAMAKEYKFEVYLYHVVQLSAPSVSHIVYVDDFSALVKDTEKKMQERVSSLAFEHPEVQFSSKVESGLLLDSINDMCAAINPVAIVMGITGEGNAIDKMIGSNAVLAMKNLNTPLLIIPHNTFFTPVTKICMACDLKNVLTATPLASIKAFTKLFRANLHILNVDFQNRHYTAETPDELENLEYILEDIQHEMHFIEHENVQDAISDFVDQNKMDMLIMIPKKHSFFESLFHKSQTKEMVYHSHVPILALHQD